MNESCQTRRMFGHNYAVPGTYEVTMVVEGRRPLPAGKHLGIIIGAFKGGVSRAWWRLLEEAEDMPDFGNDYDRFHYLNRLAETVVAIGHTTHVAVQGLRSEAL